MKENHENFQEAEWEREEVYSEDGQDHVGNIGTKNEETRENIKEGVITTENTTGTVPKIKVPY